MAVFFVMARQPCGPKFPDVCGFEITPRHTIFGRTPLDKLSARRRGFYLTTHHSKKAEINAPSGVRNQNASKEGEVDLRLSPRNHWDRH